jgi:formyltetrahydrofolate synthetase
MYIGYCAIENRTTEITYNNIHRYLCKLYRTVRVSQNIKVGHGCVGKKRDSNVSRRRTYDITLISTIMSIFCIDVLTLRRKNNIVVYCSKIEKKKNNNGRVRFIFPTLDWSLCYNCNVWHYYYYYDILSIKCKF